MADNFVRLRGTHNALAIMARMQGAGHFLRDPEQGGMDELEAALDADDENWIEEALAYAERTEAREAAGRAILRREMAGDRLVALAAWRALRGG